MNNLSCIGLAPHIIVPCAARSSVASTRRNMPAEISLGYFQRLFTKILEMVKHFTKDSTCVNSSRRIGQQLT